MIDIGANVGDTAAFMIRRPDMPVLCIEGNSAFLPYLRRNLARISNCSEVAETYVGFGHQARGRVQTIHGTASFVAGNQDIQTLTLDQILDAHPRFRNSRFLKTDTDGYDPKIIMAARSAIENMKPVLHIEFTPIGERAIVAEHIEMLDMLLAIGYKWFHIFDNFGNHMIRLQGNQVSERDSLIAYIRSARADKRPSVFYFDIVAFMPEDSDISDNLLEHYLSDRSILHI